MFDQFMQMSGPAAFAILALVAMPSLVIVAVLINRSVRRGQEIAHAQWLRANAGTAKEITVSARRGDVT